jgi:predicted ArsR family transcriptional regulator
MDTPKLHVLTILSFQANPISAETLTDIAETVGISDTPQSLRSRLVELERRGLVRRVDRTGVSRHNRPCWRWQITKDGRESFD